MREIRFRAWGKNSKEYLGYGTKDGISLTLKNIQNIEDLDNWVFEQFTGLRDKNGNEIYEGDILMDDTGRLIQYWVVEFCDGGFVGEYKGVIENLFELTRLKIVGNIHQNPELLGVE